MGPFKHTVDDGLDLRKAAFECMYTLLETCLDRLDSFEFLNHVEDGLKDHYDIKVRPIKYSIGVYHLDWFYSFATDVDVFVDSTTLSPKTISTATT